MTLRTFRTPAGVAFSALLLASTFCASTLCAPALRAQSRPAANDSPYGGVTVEEIVARVNDQIISRSDYDRALKDYDAEARQRGDSMQAISEGHKDILRGLIDQQLWLSKAKELNISGETELIKKLDEIRKQYNLDTLEDLEKAAREQGVSYEDFKANIRNSIVTQMVMQEELGHRMQITPGEVQQYFNAHKQDYVRPESVHLQEILISSGTDAPAIGGQAAGTDPAKLAAAKAKADDIESRLHSGGDFAQLARSFSDGSTAAQGGELGEFRRGALAKVLEDKTFALKSGDITEPIHTKQGYVILKVVNHTEGGVPAFKDVQQQAEEDYYMSRMEPAMRAYLTQMREEAYLDIRPGYTDTGASPKETKPIYSAYTPPAPKKKKKIERVRYRESTRTFRQKSAPAGDVAPPVEKPTDKTAATPATKPTAADKKAEAKSQQAGKKEKVRYGQAPRETLPAATATTKTEDAGALPAKTDVAANSLPDAPVAKEEPKVAKTRFSARAPEVQKAKKKAQAKTAAVEAAATPAPEDSTEIADRQQQAAPLGLAGDTAAKKKKNKNSTTSTEKTRLADQKKKQADADKSKDATTPTPAPTTPSTPQQ
jgi:peptidyl-prolyl cis-trans isomerase SurA